MPPEGYLKEHWEDSSAKEQSCLIHVKSVSNGFIVKDLKDKSNPVTHVATGSDEVKNIIGRIVNKHITS